MKQSRKQQEAGRTTAEVCRETGIIAVSSAPAMKKHMAVYLQEEHGLSRRRSAHLVRIEPSVLRYRTKRSDASVVRERLKAFAFGRPRWSPRSGATGACTFFCGAKA